MCFNPAIFEQRKSTYSSVLDLILKQQQRETYQLQNGVLIVMLFEFVVRKALASGWRGLYTEPTNVGT
jgi:hypothetical protein